MTQPRDQQVRVEALDPARSFIVRAPAGSGKTGLLIQRFLALLARVDEPEEVVAITFTIKAADEMRSRVMRALECSTPQDNDFENRTHRLAVAVRERDTQCDWRLASQPGRLRILTIDALCLSLVRQMVWVSGAGGDLRPGDDADELFRRTARNVFAQLTERDAGWAGIVETVLTLLDNNVPRFETLLVSMLGRRDQWLNYLLEFSADPRAQRANLEAALGRVVSTELECLVTQFDPALERALENVAKGVGAIDFDESLPGTRSSDLSAWQGLAACVLTKTGGVRKRFSARDGFPDDDHLKADARKLCETLAGHPVLITRLHATRTLPAPYYEDEQWQRLEALVECLRIAVTELWLVFQETGEVDFIELVNRAKVALGEPDQPTDLALALDYRIRHILVDEFQDTSLTQIDLLERLTAGWQPGDGRSLLLVGDPMQSIYRFREADVGLYLHVRDHGIGQLQLQPLTLEANFRSRPEIVDWVNETFSVVLPAQDDSGAGAVAYSASQAQRASQPQCGASVHCLVDDDGSEEARLVASLVREARDKDHNASVAILVRARSHLSKLLPQLRAAGVVIRGVNLDPLHAVPAVQDLLALTRALAYPADRIAWFSILRAPWCGLRLDDLSELGRQSAGRLLLETLEDESVLLSLSADGRERATRVRGAMHAALEVRGRCDWCTLVEQTWLALGGPSSLDEVAFGNAQAYLSLVERLDARGDGFDMERLHRLLDEQFANIPPGLADVEIMTLHNAKGLEFDCVIVPGLEREPPPERKKVIEWTTRTDTGGTRDLLLAPIHAVGEQAEPIYSYLRSLEGVRVRNESARLLYVAATRARENLHLIGNAKTSKNGLSKPSNDSLLARLWPIVEPTFEAVGNGAGAAVDLDAVEAASEPLCIRRLPSHWRSPVTASYLRQAPRLPGDEPVEFEWAGAAARHIGTVVHQMLCVMSNAGEREWTANKLETMTPRWRSVLATLGVTGEELDTASTRVAKALLRVLDDPRGKWVLSDTHTHAHSELPLSGVLDGDLVNVVLDRTFVDDNGTRWIVDYKTGVHAGGDLSTFLDREQVRYRAQLDRYARMMTGLESRPTRLGLYFPLHRGWREWLAPESPPL